MSRALRTMDTRVERKGMFGELFELAFRFLSSPAKFWNSGHFAHKRLVLQLVFAGRLAFCPNEGFRTPKTALPFKLLDSLRGSTTAVAEREEFEPGSRNRPEAQGLFLFRS